MDTADLSAPNLRATARSGVCMWRSKLMLNFNTFDTRLENELFVYHDTAFCHPYEWEITRAAQTTWLSANISYDP